MLAVDANLSNKSSVPEKFQIPDHLPTLSQKLWQAFEDQQLCDITLIAGDDGTRYDEITFKLYTYNFYVFPNGIQLCDAF